ncbi:MAG: DUF1016 N-terminal domain-containing protein [Candidatus Omnitrophota bacterium]
MPNNKLIPASYKRLVSDIASLYEGARKALVEAYWKIGQHIVQVEQQGAIKAAYGAGLLLHLSEDLTKQCGPGFSDSNLRRMRQFYLSYPKRAAPHKLTWAQYAELLPIENAAKRELLIQKAIREDLDSKAIRALVRQEAVREQVAQNLNPTSEVGMVEPPELMTPIRGTLYTYRILQPRLVGAGNSELLIDLGFSSYQDLDNITSRKFKAGDIISSAKDAKGNYALKTPSPNPLPGGEDKGEEALFTYQAEVEKVVDGDTLRVVVDLGFGFKTRQYLRLRGLDCPEMTTPEGKKAAEFVRARIRTADQIVLTSSKSDKYDRYLADVFYADKTGTEQFLNNVLLENGYAVKL